MKALHGRPHKPRSYNCMSRVLVGDGCIDDRQDAGLDYLPDVDAHGDSFIIQGWNQEVGAGADGNFPHIPAVGQGFAWRATYPAKNGRSAAQGESAAGASAENHSPSRPLIWIPNW